MYTSFSSATCPVVTGIITSSAFSIDSLCIHLVPLHLDVYKRQRQKTQTFCENYSDESFGDVYTLKSNISSVLDGKSNQNRQTQLAAPVSYTHLDVYKRQC